MPTYETYTFKLVKLIKHCTSATKFIVVNKTISEFKRNNCWNYQNNAESPAVFGKLVLSFEWLSPEHLSWFGFVSRDVTASFGSLCSNCSITSPLLFPAF